MTIYYVWIAPTTDKTLLTHSTTAPLVWHQQNVGIPTAQTQKTQYSNNSYNTNYMYDDMQNTITGDEITTIDLIRWVLRDLWF